MTDAERIAELLLEWEDRREHGTDVSAEELCRDCPHLLPMLTRRINALKATSWLTRGDDDPLSEPSHSIGPASAPTRRTLSARREDR